MTAEAQEWLPEIALTAVEMVAPLARLLAEWSAIWMPSAKLSEAAAQHRYRQRAERDRLQSLECGRHAADGEALGALAELATTLALGLILDECANADPDSLPDPQASAYDSLAWAEMNHKVAETIEALPEREAYIIRNHYRNGVSFQQIATVLGLSKGRVSQIHRSALMRMREQLARFR